MSDEPVIAYYYRPEHNPEGGALPGVPLADLTKAQFDAFPAWLQASITALPCYTTAKPRAVKTEKDASDSP